MKDAKRRVRADIVGAVPVAAPPGGGKPPPAAPEFITKLFFEKDGKIWRNRDNDSAPLWVCTSVVAMAETRDDDGFYGILLAWTDRDGLTRNEVYSRDKFVGEGGELRTGLGLGGVLFNKTREGNQAWIEYINVMSSSERIRVVGRSGWHFIDGVSIYAMSDQVFGKVSTKVILQTQSREPNLFQQAGRLEAWRETIGRFCIENSRLCLAVSMAFAAPLLHLVGEDGGGINIYGQSRCGKSTIGIAAASVCGGDTAAGGARAAMRTWRSTANSTEAVALVHSDICLVLDELGQCDARSVGDTVYMLSNGVGRSRMGRDALLRSVARFRCLYLSTGEMTLSAKMAEANVVMKAGQGVRLVDVAADDGVGLGAFRQLHGAENFQALVADIREAARCYFGTPIRAFLAFLIDRMERDRAFPELLRDEIDRLSKLWLADLGPVEGQVRTVARRFALIAVGGNLATDAGITAWGTADTGEREAVWAAHRCFQSWLGDRGGNVGQAEDAQAVAQLRAFVSRNGASRFEDWREAKVNPAAQTDIEPDETPPQERFRTVNRAGWRRWVDVNNGHQWRYYLSTEGMHEALAGLDYKAALKVLVAQGMILPGKGEEIAKPLRIPGVGRQRVYECPASVMSAGTGPVKAGEEE